MTAKLGMDFFNLDDCRKIVKRRLNTSNFECVNFDIQAPAQRTGFLGDHYRIVVNVTNNEEDNNFDRHQELVFFAKVIPEIPEQREMVENCGFFKKEAMFYRILAPEFEAIERDVKVFPKCYMAKNDIIVLEDVRLYGFNPVEDTHKMLSFEECKQVLYTLACLHSSHFIAEDRLGRKLTDFCPEKLQEAPFAERRNNKFTETFMIACQTCIEMVPILPKYKNDPSLVKGAQSQLPGLYREFFQLMGEDPDTRNVFCHGDLWASNMMFKRTEKGQPEQVVLVDFQLMRLGAPASDVLTFLYLSTSRAFREKHLETLLEFYYNTLAAEVLRHGLNMDSIISRQDFRASCKKHTKTAVIIPTLYYQVTHYPNDRMARIFSDSERYFRYFFGNRIDEVVDAFEKDSIFRELMNEAMEEMIDELVVNKMV